jgi:hypothetical protein
MLERKRAVAIAAAAVLCLAAAIAAGLLFARRTGQPSNTDPNFVWLETAMKDCDAEAGKTPDALYFLVVPLADEPRDDPGWRRVSINDIGNAILISGEDMLAGLRRKALRLSADPYVFSVRGEGNKEVLAWKQTTGAKKFVSENAAGIATFRVQFQGREPGRSLNWGSPFERVPGNCYWVNAILRH